MRKKGYAPIPISISDWGDRTEIIYSCPHCDCSFRFFGNKELYCHRCGTEINWDSVPTHLTTAEKDTLNHIEAEYGKHHDIDVFLKQRRELLYGIYSDIVDKQKGELCRTRKHRK